MNLVINNRKAAPAIGERVPMLCAAAVILCVGLTGCDSVLEVDDHDVTRPAELTDPAALPTVRAGAIGDFTVGYSGQGGNTETLITSVGLFTDELFHAGTFSTRREVDKRGITPRNAGMTTVFRNLHRGRRSTEIAAQAYAEVDPNTAEHAEMTNLAGYTYVFFGENYCSGVPFSQLREDFSFEFGDPLTTVEIFDRALQHFGDAATIAAAAESEDQTYLAQLGRARALMNLGDYAAAADLVASIPTDWTYRLEHSDNSDRQFNGIWAVTHGTRRYAVAHGEGGNGLPFRTGNADGSDQDPRVRWTRNADLAGVDAPYAHFFQQNYPSREAIAPLAAGVEARLIEAEAALADQEVGAFVDIHNGLRARIGLPPLDLAGVVSPDDRIDLHFAERAFHLYLTGQRLADLRRLVRQYGRDSEAVFPTGQYARLSHSTLSPVPDGSYASDVNFPVPFDEQNNTNFTQCVDRAP